MTIRILVNGAAGKMGQITCKTIAENRDFILVQETSEKDDLLSAIQKSQADIVIDFTNAESVFKNTETIIKAAAHPVIGTSGLKDSEIKHLQELSKDARLGGIIAPNFSLGAVLMMKYAAEIAKYFKDMEVIEMHHAGKQDSPSGTAMKTAEMLSKARAAAIPLKPSRETIPGARGATLNNIPIHSIRLPGFLAHQEIIFGALGETLTIRHDTIDRQCFMAGVVLACKKVQSLDHLVYGLESLL
jgi:4-hydroxy-tetrahydrodipicolinate reductase